MNDKEKKLCLELEDLEFPKVDIEDPYVLRWDTESSPITAEDFDKHTKALIEQSKRNYLKPSPPLLISERFWNELQKGRRHESD